MNFRNDNMELLLCVIQSMDWKTLLGYLNLNLNIFVTTYNDECFNHVHRWAGTNEWLKDKQDKVITSHYTTN